VEKITPKNKVFYQDLSGVWGTFASSEKQGLIIDKSGLRTMNRFPISIGINCRAEGIPLEQDSLVGVTDACHKIQKEF